MELRMEVVLSSSIKRKKPWPRFCWLGREKESVFLLDDKRISEINMMSGRTKKRTPKLHPLLNSVVTMTSSHSGTWLCGLLVSGELFLWNRDKDLLKTAAAVPEVVHMITAVHGNATRLSLLVSGDGMRVLLVAITGQVLLWECMDVRDLMGVRDGTVKGQWAHIHPLEDSILPSSQDKEASQHTIFIKTEVMGDVCLSAFIFTSWKKLIITCLKIQWEEGQVRVGVGYSIQWATKTYPLSRFTPPCQPVKSRGALVPAFSPDGQLLAIVLNQRQPKATQVLFVSTQNFVSISSGLGGCGSKKMDIPSKYIRSYWVGSVNWSPGGLFLACVLKRGSLLMVSRLGGLLTLTSSGCSDFRPAHFLPLHPLVTYRPPICAGKAEASMSSSSLSVRDVLRQRYSVTWHPRLFYFIVSDGYMATVLRVLDRPSPALLLKTLLKDTSRDLEKASRILDKSQIHVREWLESLSCLHLESSPEVLNPIVPCGPKSTDSVLSAATDGSNLPLFLQDQGTFGGTKELLEKVQTFFEDDSDLDGAPAGSHVEDSGRLEFASMFDTLHALDTQTDTGFATSPDYEKESVEMERKTPRFYCELGKIQRKLLTAWAFGMSLGNAVENRNHLLKHTINCVVRFAALLHLIPNSLVHTGKKNTSAFTCLLHLLKVLLSFLPWDGIHSDGPRCLRLVVDLSKQLIHLLLTPHPESHQMGHCQLSSHSLSTVLLVLQQVSDSLDHAYSLQQRTVWTSAEKELHSPQLWSSDVHHVPLLQDEKEEKFSFEQQAKPVPQQPSSRLLGVWQWVYEITQQYMEELKSFKGCDGWEEEQEQLSAIMSQIQTALQATGERLEKGPALLSYPGELLFLCASYPKSADTWRSQICEESNKSGDRSVFKQTQLCLALLYSLLSQYCLREAQELGDHMARLILNRAGQQKDNTTDCLPCPWLPVDLHSDAACAVVQSLGRFMASYFTNQPLYISPPHHVAALPPLHVPHAPSVGRLVPLCQEDISRAVRRQQLSEVWTVDYAQDLLLLGGLLPETVWLAYHLGDWKTAASLSLAYRNYCSDHFDFTQFRRRELHLPTVLEPESIFQVQLGCLLANKSDSQECRDKDGDESFTDPLEGEDWDMLQVSIQEILKASVMAGVNVMSSPLSSLLETAKDLCSCLPTLVPNGLYLPSPPLYCPQPSPNTQDPAGTIGQFAEVASRHKVSGVLQRLLLLLRSARCCHPAAQWYISHLRRARHVLHKIKKKYSYPSAPQEEKAFPEGLMKFVSRSGFFRRGPNKDGHLDPDTIRTIICFREMCALCWMLHVRDQLSISCRKYQAARQHDRDDQIPAGSEVRSTCVDALRWACRFLPFSCFLNAEEILQDILLSLVSELPPLALVADTLAHAFPEEEESVRVPLREKYNSLLQRLRQCNVLEGEKGEANELMMIVLQDKRRQRRKHLGRLRRHLAPPELHLWEKEEEEEDRGSKHGMAMLRQLSLGTTLSTSTLTDCGFPPVCSDGDTADNTSEAISPEINNRAITRGKRAKKVREHAKKTAVNIESVIQEESQPGDDKENERPSLPVVGTWDFELEDEEYLNFLELFLSYVLEKDSVNGGDSGSELPLLKGFSSQLRERELHSLTFDVLTTIHRRQRDAHHPARKHLGHDRPVFRAGCCYKPVKQGATAELQTPSVLSEAPVSRANLSVTSLPGLKTGRQKGLFGVRQQSSVPFGHRMKGDLFGSEGSRSQNAFPLEEGSESLIFGSSICVESVIELQQGLDPKLEAQFPELGRLLEWMVRWADRRVLLGHHGKKKKDRGGGVGGTADEGVVIRVKASAPAVLTSLSLLQRRYTALLGTDHYSAHIQVPETQWTVAPVLQPEVDRKLERESSVDTGYPGSANTPITGLDHNPQQGDLPIASFTDEPEELTFLRIPHPNDQDQLNFDDEQRQFSPQPVSLGDLDVTPEKEGKSSDSEALEGLSSVSNRNPVEIIGTPDTSLKLADLDISENADDVSSSISLHSDAKSPQAALHPEPQVSPIVQPEVSAELSGSAGVPLHNTAVNHPSLHPQRSTISAPAADSTAPDQLLSTETPQMRQRLGEDLFRLVQNINYMSLMEVLGASFSNLQLAQQRSSLAQTQMNPSHPNDPITHSRHATNSFPQSNVLPVQTTLSEAPPRQAWVESPGNNNPQFGQAPACMFGEQPVRQISGKTSPTSDQHHTTKILPSAANGVGVHYQEMQPLSVKAVSPEIQFRESGRLIPPSQGLLATADTSHNAPVLPPSNESIQSEAAPQISGLKLLQLHHPQLSHQTSQHHPPTQTLSTPNFAIVESHPYKFKNIDQSTSKRTEEEKRSGSSVPKRHLSCHSSHDPTQPKVQTSGRSRRQEFSLLAPALPAHTPAPMQGLRLLHFQPVPQSNITFPKVPLPSSSRPPAVISALIGEAPMIKLLHIESGPNMMLPLAAPPAQMTRLISMEELTSSVIGRQSAEEARPRLLRVDPPAESTRRPTTSLNSSSSKRQKRRKEKEGRARKAEVTFRPNESIILTQEPSNESVNGQSAAAEGITSGQVAAIPYVSGSFDSLLTGQRLLDAAMCTSAELHAFASTHKRPPECHDAFTNTDPACPPTVVDKAVSASVTASSPKLRGLGNQPFFSEPFVQDTEETPQGPGKNLDQNGRQFISVLDLEDKALHQDLPPSLSPGAPDVPPVHPTPTSAALHLLATSVIRSSAATDPQPTVTIPEDLLRPATHTDIPEGLPSLSHMEPSMDPQRTTPQDFADPSDSEICRAIKTQSVGPHSASSTPPAIWFSSRLSELDAQLAALQNIADYLEMDFSNSRMLVNTIEKLTPVVAPDVKTTAAIKKTVRLSVPQDASIPVDTTAESNSTEEEEEHQEEEFVVHNNTCAPERKPTPSHSQNAGPSYLQNPPKMRDQLAEVSGILSLLEDENLGQTGLSDTAEILDELVKEGYLSLTDVDFSNSQTAHSSRLEQQQSSWMSQKRVLPEDERRELRIWMRRKQRERLAVYQKHKESLREREHKPFSASRTAKPTNKNQGTVWKTREEKEKFILLEKYNQRTREALSLANEFPINPPTFLISSRAEGSPVPSTVRSNFAPPHGGTHRAYSAPANDKRSLKSGQTQPHPRPWTAEMQGRPSADHRRRLGLHRPVTSLPRDRLSQMTRRGMLSDRKCHSKPRAADQSEERHFELQGKKWLNRSPSRGTTVGRGILRVETRIEEKEEGNSLEPTSQLNRRLGPEESNIVLAGLLDEQDEGVRAGVSDMDWLDNLSETGSSSLSKIDWAAIEKMVAAEET